MSASRSPRWPPRPGVALGLLHESLASGLASHRELEAVTGLLLGEREAARQLIEAGAFPQGGR